jgi:hypothetical protein
MFLQMLMEYIKQTGMDVSEVSAVSSMSSSTTQDDLIAILVAEMESQGVGRGHGDRRGKSVVAREVWVLFV